MNLKLIISDSFYFFRSHLTQISTLCLPWLFAVAVASYLTMPTQEPTPDILMLFISGWVFKQLIYPIYTAALILLMAKSAQREQPDNKALIAQAIKIWQPYFVLHMMSIGLIILGILPFFPLAIYISVRLSFADFYLVVEKASPLEAMQRSFKATRPWRFFFQILLLLALFFFPLFLLYIILSGIFAAQEAGLIAKVLIDTATLFLMLFVDVLRFRIFMSISRDGEE